ncbi:uncharacterized protein TM35_000401160 [Trypanosoma theileri]|uniref:PH-like domain-containing protein n=1 Tax=Trypanosoma theileri TaxID=67003 RepID=A0A1X0NL20_9TRYP|nr:uncharacterized protein TM35_000401160 [Trypanosoma theileri]ORC84849.1 hypothetical protein TM35_000401160 [Trypanosoma theileri]
MVPRLKKRSLSLASSASLASYDTPVVSRNSSIESLVVLRRSRKRKCVQESLNTEKQSRAQTIEISGQYKRCAPDVSCKCSAEIKRYRNENFFDTKVEDVLDNSFSSFKGLAGISLSHDLFDGAFVESRKMLRRQCFQPQWSMIGTFKTTLHSLVDVDPRHDIIKWFQKTPNGDFQQMRVLLSSVKETKVLSATAEELTPFLVVVSTSTRPSQIIFGFEKLVDANRMKAAIYLCLTS